MSLTKESLKNYMNPVFIETGTNKGRGVKMALECGFKQIFSVEIKKDLYEKVLYLEDDNRIKLFNGGSADILADLLPTIDLPITFYLDAHEACENTQVTAELAVIKDFYIEGSVILIDDIKDLYKDTIKVRRQLWDINPKFKLKVIDGFGFNGNRVRSNDILVAE